MNKLLDTLFAATLVAFAGIAAAKAETPQQDPPVIAEEISLDSKFTAVCQGNFVLSDKAKAACDSHTLPKALKSGKRFAASGIGAEFNVLYAQVKH